MYWWGIKGPAISDYNKRLIQLSGGHWINIRYLNFTFQAMDGEKSAENKSSKDAGKQAELAFKLYDKV